jgi:hypothetical protein
MKTILNKTAKNEVFSFSGFSKLNLDEMMKIRGGDSTTGGDPTKKVPD